MRKTIAAFIMLTGFNVFFCYGQEKGVPDYLPKDEGYALVKPLKDVFKQIQEAYHVNLLFETKVEGVTTAYRLNTDKDVEQVLRELLSPLMLTSVRLNTKNYIIKALPASNKLTDSNSSINEGEPMSKEGTVERVAN